MSVPPSQPAELTAQAADFEVPPPLTFVHPPRIVPKPPPITIPTFDLPDSDGIPMETPWHGFAMNLLIEIVRSHFRQRTDYFVGGNNFVYYRTPQTRGFRGPDFFFVDKVDGTRKRRYWMIYEEGGRAPDVIIELTSPSTARVDHTTKKEIYERILQTREYYCYDPDSQLLEGWRLESEQYQPITANERGWLWCEGLQLWLGTWEGEHLDIRAVWPRFFDRQGELVPGYGEAAIALAQAESARAQAAITRAQAESARAEAAITRAQTESARAEAAITRAQAESARAQAESARAQTESARAQALEAKLKAAEEENARLKAIQEAKGIEP